MNNLPDDVTQKMIDDHYAEPKQIENEPYFMPDDGCNLQYSACVLEEFLADCNAGGGCEPVEFENLMAHMENIRNKGREVLPNIQIKQAKKHYLNKIVGFLMDNNHGELALTLMEKFTAENYINEVA